MKSGFLDKLIDRIDKVDAESLQAHFLHLAQDRGLLEIDAYNFVSCLNCVAAQRLVRRNCPHCTKPVKYDRKILEESGLSYEKYAQVEFMAGEGCEESRFVR